jgi:hypothetical protein
VEAAPWEDASAEQVADAFRFQTEDVGRFVDPEELRSPMSLVFSGRFHAHSPPS